MQPLDPTSRSKRVRSKCLLSARNDIQKTLTFLFLPPKSRISIEVPSLEVLTAYLQKQQQSDDSSDGGLQSDIGFQIPKSKDPTPFSSKQVWRESDTPHSKASTEQIHTASNASATGSSTHNSSEDQKLLMPGDITEMNKFCDDAQNSSKLQVNITLPIVSLQLK